MSKKVNSPLCEADINDIEYVVCHVGLLWRRLINARIKSLGVSGTEKRVLFCIARMPGLTQVKIAALLDLEPQNLMRTLDKLEKQGWIEKRADSQDRRVKCLFVTPQASTVISRVRAISDSIKPEVLDGINEKDMQTVVEYLTRMRVNLLKQLEAAE